MRFCLVVFIRFRDREILDLGTANQICSCGWRSPCNEGRFILTPASSGIRPSGRVCIVKLWRIAALTNWTEFQNISRDMRHVNKNKWSVSFSLGWSFYRCMSMAASMLSLLKSGVDVVVDDGWCREPRAPIHRSSSSFRRHARRRRRWWRRMVGVRSLGFPVLFVLTIKLRN